MSEEYGRVFQDFNFTVEGFAGKKLEQLIGVEHPEKPWYGPFLFYLKAEGQVWHQFYLELGAGFWENIEEPETDDESYLFKDYATLHDLQGKIFQKIHCMNGTVFLEFASSEKYCFRVRDENDEDAGYVFEKI